MPTDYRSMFDKEYIGAWDLAEGDKTITITRVKAGELVAAGGRKAKKPVVFFEGSEKGFALNSTNGKTIAAMYGNYVEKWVGKSITLYKSMTQMAGVDTECIRVRPQAPKATKRVELPEEEPDNTPITEQQALELNALCTEGGKDLTADLKEMAEVEKIGDIPARVFGRVKKWITTQRLTEHQGTQA